MLIEQWISFVKVAQLLRRIESAESDAFGSTVEGCSSGGGWLAGACFPASPTLCSSIGRTAFFGLSSAQPGADTHTKQLMAAARSVIRTPML